MAGSNKNRALGQQALRHLRDELALPPRTPGSLGLNDAGDPTRLSLLGDTPGPTGNNDWGAPEKLSLPGLKTFHDWARETEVHLPVDMQSSKLYPAGKKEEVLNQAIDFLIKKEGVPEYPYLPTKDGVPIGVSGITIGVGYDLGQHDEKKIRKDWAELDRLSQPYDPSKRSLGMPSLRLRDENIVAAPPSAQAGESKLSLGLDRLRLDEDNAIAGEALRLLPPPVPPSPQDKKQHSAPLPKLPTLPPLDPVWKGTPLDRLTQAATRKKFDAVPLLKGVEDIKIPKELSLKVFKESTLQETYQTAVTFFSGLTELPTGVQVAILSLVYNTGTTHHKEGKVKIPGTTPASMSNPQGFSFRIRGLPSPAGKSKLSLGLAPLHLNGEEAPAATPDWSASFGLEPSHLEPKPAVKDATPEPKEVPTYDEDIFGNDWEKKELRTAVFLKDIVWIYWYFESTRRIWAYDETCKDLVKRRDAELELIRPYVMADLQHEAFLQRFRHR